MYSKVALFVKGIHILMVAFGPHLVFRMAT